MVCRAQPPTSLWVHPIFLSGPRSVKRERRYSRDWRLSPISSRMHCKIQADTWHLQIPSREEGKEIQVKGTKLKITILIVEVSTAARDDGRNATSSFFLWKEWLFWKKTAPTPQRIAGLKVYSRTEILLKASVATLAIPSVWTTPQPPKSPSLWHRT